MTLDKLLFLSGLQLFNEKGWNEGRAFWSLTPDDKCLTKQSILSDHWTTVPVALTPFPTFSTFASLLEEGHFSQAGGRKGANYASCWMAFYKATNQVTVPFPDAWPASIMPRRTSSGELRQEAFISLRRACRVLWQVSGGCGMREGLR